MRVLDEGLKYRQKQHICSNMPFSNKQKTIKICVNFLIGYKQFILVLTHCYNKRKVNTHSLF